MLQHKKIIELLYASVPDLKNKACTESLAHLGPIISELERDKDFFYWLEQTEKYPKILAPSLSTTFSVSTYRNQYIAFGLDGSQIYPDRHYNISCFVINIATIGLEYQNKNPFIVKKTEPFLFTSWDTFGDQVSTNDIVDTERFLKELECGLNMVEMHQEKLQIPYVVFIDGPLTFWHLFNKPLAFQEHFIKKYEAILKTYEEKQIPVIGYTSKPRSKELVLIIKKYTQYKNIRTTIFEEINNLTDCHILSLFLKPMHHTVFFKNNEQIASCYIDTGKEYARLEIPAWILLKNKELQNFVLSAAAHQINNGFGYPTVLSLAHHEAVIKENDRQLFIKTLHKILEKEGINPRITAKNISKLL